jgi:hypothetical protein
MKSHIRAFFGHRAVQVVTFTVVTLVALAGFGLYAQNNGLLKNDKTPSITWLTSSNVASELSISQTSTGAITAKPGQPVLLIECPTEACESSTLNVPAVIKQFEGKVKILAIDPYAQKGLAAALEQSFITSSVQNAIVNTLAEQVAQQKAGSGKTITAADVQAVLQDSTFQSQVQQVLSSPQTLQQLAPSLYALLQPVYPKFFVFDGSFNLLSAATGIDIANESDLAGLIMSATTSASTASGSSTDSTTGGASSTTTGGASTTTTGASTTSTTPSASPSPSSSTASAPSTSASSAASGSGK